jgi:hypothetical protein
VSLLDCKRFHKIAGADLTALDQALLAHSEKCEDCARFLVSAQAFDVILSEAINVEVAADLNSRIETRLDVESSEHSGSEKRTPRYMAVAASLLLIVGVSFLANNLSQSDNPTLEQVVLSHINSEPEMLSLASYIPQDDLKKSLLGFGAKLQQPMANVSHVELCDIGDTKGIHLVMKGEKGPVTLLLLPTIKSKLTHSFAEGGWVGYTEPLGQGTIAIVGKQGEALDKIDRSVRDAISWI